MNNDQISNALNGLVSGAQLRTPDKAKGAAFSILSVTDEVVTIKTSGDGDVNINKAAFLAAHDFLRDNGHDSFTNGCRIGSSNSEEGSGELCQISKELNNGTRCITYIIPILASIGAVGFSGDQPNRCWYIKG